MALGQKVVALVNIKIAGIYWWVFTQLTLIIMIIIGVDTLSHVSFSGVLELLHFRGASGLGSLLQKMGVPQSTVD